MHFITFSIYVYVVCKINSYCYVPCVSSYEKLTNFYNDIEFSCRESADVDWYDTAYIAPNVADSMLQ